MSKLKYISTAMFESLRNSVHENLERYLTGSFGDLTTEDGWSIPLDLELNLGEFRALKPESGVEAEVLNSLIVWRALSKLTPSLATESRIWTRLTHIEGLEYSRARWIKGETGATAEKAIEAHFFGESRTRYRDDNAIGRLWWNAYIAKLAMPDRQFDALKLLLKKADIRSNIVERAWITSRPQIAGGIVRALERQPSISANEAGFRAFMKAVNTNGGGLLFEAMSIGEIDGFMNACANETRAG